MKTFDVLGIDYGASNGRAVVGTFNGRKLALDIVHRFSNHSLSVFSNGYWDILFLYQQAIESIKKARSASHTIKSIAIDSWALDFGLLDKNGKLLDGVHAYRDTRTTGMIDVGRQVFSDLELFRITGLAPTEITTLYQLLAVQRQDHTLLEHAKVLLFVPNLLTWFLTGQVSCDSTIASSSMLFNLSSQTWSDKILTGFDLPGILPPLQQHGTIIGTIHAGLAEQEQIDRIPAISIAHHDTAAAFSSVPARERDQVVAISCGTWSVVGCYIQEPMLDQAVFQQGFCNELGYQGQVILAKNLTGLFILQECVREWSQSSYEVDYRQLAEAALTSDFDTEIDVTFAAFSLPGHMTEKITAYCLEQGLKPPITMVEFYMSIVLGLVSKYIETIKKLQKMLHKTFKIVHLIGGGARDAFLCTVLSRKLGWEVVAGPYEATVIGNICGQLMAQGEINGLPEFVEVIEASFGVDRYQ